MTGEPVLGGRVVRAAGGTVAERAAEEAAAAEPRQRDAAAIATRDLADDPSAVLTLLEPDQIVAAKHVRLGPRSVSRGMAVVLWSLRVYVVFMLVVVAIQVARAIAAHGAGG